VRMSLPRPTSKSLLIAVPVAVGNPVSGRPLGLLDVGTTPAPLGFGTQTLQARKLMPGRLPERSVSMALPANLFGGASQFPVDIVGVVSRVRPSAPAGVNGGS
jgi:hypothetical protein